MSVSTDVPKFDLTETLKTWPVPAKTIAIMRVAIVTQRAEAIQNHWLKPIWSPKAVNSTLLALSDIDLWISGIWM